MIARFALTRRLVLSKNLDALLYTPGLTSPSIIRRRSPVLSHAHSVSFFSSNDKLEVDINFYKGQVIQEEQRGDETFVQQGKPPSKAVQKTVKKLSKSRIAFLKWQKAKAHDPELKMDNRNKESNNQRSEKDQSQSTPSVQAKNLAHETTNPSSSNKTSKKVNNEPNLWSNFDLFVSCLPGLEPLLEMEMKALGLNTDLRAGGILTSTSSLMKVLECHLCLGTASHVLLRCGPPFKARGFPELERKVSRIPWRKLLKSPVTLDVRATCIKSKLYHSGAVAERVEKEIYKSLGISKEENLDNNQDKNESSSSSSKSQNCPTVHVTVRLDRDVVQISVDTSSTPLHQRGYRLQSTKAPLREDLAYGLLLSSGWTPIHYHNQTSKQSESITPPKYTKLLDPFCGSGTIAIEAAGMAAGLQPGRLRPSPLRGTRLSNSRMWRDVRRNWSKKITSPQTNDDNTTNDDDDDDEIIPTVNEDGQIFIAGSDRDKGAVDAAKANAERAGVDKWIDFTVGAVSSHPWFNGDLPSTTSGGSLLVATNPPYGRRVSPNKDLLPLYQTLGEKIKNLDDTNSESTGAAIMSQHVKLARQSGVSSLEAAFTSKHGGLSVTAMVTKTINR